MSKKISYPVLCTALLGTLLTVSPLSIAGEQDVYIPADTLFYMGTGSPVAVKDIFALIPDFATFRDSTESIGLDGIDDLLDDPAAGLAAWGIEDKVSFSAYSVGLSPVLRISLSDSEKFNQALRAYETKRGLKSDRREQDGWTISLYSPAQLSGINDSESEDNSSAGAAKESATTESDNSSGTGEADSDVSSVVPSLVVGVNETDAVVGFVADADDKQSIQVVLGITKPEQSIAANEKMRNLRKKWGYGEGLAAFIDFQQIAAVVTDESNPVGQQLQDSGFLSGAMRGYLDQLRSEPCRAEVTQLVSSWPMVVGGYRNFEVSEKQINFDAHMAVVIGHEKLKETLKLFRGLMPSSQSSSKPMLSLELGLTVDNLAQALGQLSEMTGSVRYQCQALYPLNSIAARDLGVVSMGVVMFGGLARGVRGVSVNIFDADIDPAQGLSAVKSIDSAIAVTADDPAMLVGTLRMLPQFGALADLPLDGSEIDVTSAFPLPLPAGVQIKAAMKGNNVVLFSGENSTDFANRLAQNQSEGFFLGKANTRLILDKLTASLANEGDVEGREQIMEILDQYLQGELSYSLDFTDNGVEVVSKGLVDRRVSSEETSK